MSSAAVVKLIQYPYVAELLNGGYMDTYKYMVE